jgi:lysophospholipase L1-like esterase
MNSRSVMSSALAAVLATSITAISLVAVPGVSGAATRHAKKAPVYYLSLGDSYSIGYQPPAVTATDPTGGTAGYTAYVARKEKMTLENFGCGGATTSSIGDSIGCSQPAASDAVPYPSTTQEQAALNFIATNPGQVGLITVSIGGNDVTACADQSGLSAIIACVETADSSITTNVTDLVSSLNSALSAAGDTAEIVGLTYPDVILGQYVNPGGSAAQSLASDSVEAFDDLINPTLRAAYTSVTNGLFVNVTQAPYKKATAGDDSDTPTAVPVNLKPYGKIPPAVWEICKLTYYCVEQNIHANTKGYTFIGKLIIAALDPSAV